MVVADCLTTLLEYIGNLPLDKLYQELIIVVWIACHGKLTVLLQVHRMNAHVLFVSFVMLV